MKWTWEWSDPYEIVNNVVFSCLDLIWSYLNSTDIWWLSTHNMYDTATSLWSPHPTTSPLNKWRFLCFVFCFQSSFSFILLFLPCSENGCHAPPPELGGFQSAEEPRLGRWGLQQWALREWTLVPWQRNVSRNAWRWRASWPTFKPTQCIAIKCRLSPLKGFY